MERSWNNVILLSADALRADHLTSYGYTRETSPVLDELAAESLQFLNVYSASSHTREAIPALLTGRYPDEAIGSNYQLATETIASVLSREGLATGGFHSNPYVSRAYGFDRGFDVFDDDLHFGKHKLIALAQRALDKLRNRHYARAEEINKRSLAWLDSLEEGESFFLWNHYMDTHGPYEPPAEYQKLYRDVSTSKKDAQTLYKRAIDEPESITDAERQELIDLYDAEIRYNDEQIGRFLTALRERDLLKDSLLIFTSDHGDAFGEHGYYEHPRYLHDEITRVPLLVQLPNGVKAGETVTTPVSTLDIMPTIKQTMGLPTKGISLLDPPTENRPVYLQARGEKEEKNIRRYAVKTNDGFCFCERDRESESIEFVECTDRTLRRILEDHIKKRVRRESGESATEPVSTDEEIERRLNALGYTE